MNINVKKIIKVGRNTFFRSPKNLLLKKINKTLKPQWLVFMPTGRCNSKCKHCNIWQNPPDKNPLTLKEIEIVLSDPLFKNLKEIINTGGEASLRNDLEQIFLIEHKLFPKANLQLSTNGLLPKRIIDFAKYLLEKDVPISIGISLDGIDEEHDKTRGVPDNFKRVDQLLKKLIDLKKNHEKKLDIAIGFTLSDLTLESLEKVEAYGKKMELPVLVQWYNQAPFYGNIKNNLGTNKELIKKVESFLPSFMKEMWLSSLKEKLIGFPCFALNTFCVLTWNGDIVPCLNYFNLPTGNVREKYPTEIWKSIQAKQIRKIINKCPGCLNQWACGWSLESCTYPILNFYLTHPQKLLQRFKKRGIE